MDPSAQLLHHKQRTTSGSSGNAMSKDPPPKYMDAKMAGASKKIAPISSHGTNKYPDKPVAQPPPPTHVNQSHLASKSSNYHQPTHQQLPPNYSQSMSHRSTHQQQQSGDYHHLSVQQQQHQPTSQNNPYANNMSSDSSYSVAGRPPPDDHMHSMMMDTTDKTKAQSSSIFSPDWTDTKPPLKVLPPLDSPKLPATDRQQRTDTTPKKDKLKQRESPMNAAGFGGQKTMSSSSLYPGAPQDPNKRSNHSSSAGITAKRDYTAPQTLSYDKTVYGKSRQPMMGNASVKLEDTEEDPRSIVKRSHSEAGQFDDPMSGDYHRDSKFRKYDVDTAQQQPHCFGGGSSSYAAVQSGLHLKGTSTFNGIETNPDLVSSLLKESLAESKYSSTIKMESMPPHQILQTTPMLLDQQQPQQHLLSHPESITKSHFQAPPPPYLHQQQHTSAPMTIDSAPVAHAPPPLVHELPPANAEFDHDHKTKSEKKKKKEKSKHKEKDKTRDREDRKKHKKDKDRNRDKESRGGGDSSSSGVMQNPIKIKIPKEKLNLSGSTDGSVVAPPTAGFKITIPKDRMATGSASDATAPPAGASLKIKISKDVIENYHGGYSSSGVVGGYDGGADGSGSSAPTIGQQNYHSKKRDRSDRSEVKGGHHDATVHRSGGGNSGGTTKVIICFYLNFITLCTL